MNTFKKYREKSVKISNIELRRIANKMKKCIGVLKEARRLMKKVT
jgi:hypothetical protein